MLRFKNSAHPGIEIALNLSMRGLISKVKVWGEKQKRFRDLFVLAFFIFWPRTFTVKVEPSLAKVLVLLSIFILPLGASAQGIPSDPITDNMQRYLQYLNIPGYTEGKMTHQLEFMQKVRSLWSREKFQELRHKSLKEIIETQIGHPLFASAVAFHEENVEETLKHIQDFEIPENKKETVIALMNRAVQFRNVLRSYGFDKVAVTSSTVVSWNQDASVLAWLDADSTGMNTLFNFYDVQTGEVREVSTGREITHIAISPNGQWIVLAQKGRGIFSYHRSNWQHIYAILLSEIEVEGISFNPIDLSIVVYTPNRLMVVPWENPNGPPSVLLGVQYTARNSFRDHIRWTRDGKTLVCLESGHVKRFLTEDEFDMGKVVGMSLDGKYLASLDDHIGLKVMNLETMKLTFQMSPQGIENRRHDSLSPSGTRILFLDPRGQMSLYSISNGFIDRWTPTDFSSSESAIAVSDKQYAVARSHRIYVYDLKTKTLSDVIDAENPVGTFNSAKLSFITDDLLLSQSAFGTEIWHQRAWPPDLSLLYLADPDHGEDR